MRKKRLKDFEKDLRLLLSREPCLMDLARSETSRMGTEILALLHERDIAHPHFRALFRKKKWITKSDSCKQCERPEIHGFHECRPCEYYEVL